MKMTAQINQKPVQHRFIVFFTLLMFLPLMFSSSVNADFNGSIEASAGYDNNASLSPENKGSGFVLYRAKLDFHFPPKDLPVDFYLFTEDNYQQYFRLEDNYRLKAGISLIWQTFGGRLLPGIFAEGSAYRDGLNISDERDEMLAGIQLDWLASARLNLGIRQSWSWLDYCNPTVVYTPFDKTPMPQREFPSDRLPLLQEQEMNQKDFIRSTGIESKIYINSKLQADLSLENARCASSIPVESYTSNGFTLSFLWALGEAWEFNPIIQSKWLKYKHFPQGMKREDTQQRLGLNISRFIGAYELFFRTDWTRNNSDLETETYRRTVMQCGLSWSF